MSVRGTPHGGGGGGGGMLQHSNDAAQQLADRMPTVDIGDVAEPLAEGNNYPAADRSNTLKRTLNVAIKASLSDLCLQKNRGTWAPSADALRAMFQQRRFTNLEGATEHQGDLKSMVLHSLAVSHVKSSFPVALGTNVVGVDNSSYSLSGESYSAIVLPNAESTQTKILQADDVSLAYEFARKFPGYTSDNLATKGVHEVSQRRFVLIAADHPIVHAISENAEKLQLGEIAMMPEGLIKISSGLYKSILPLVRTQVDSQIKVRDLSRAAVTIKPADFASWSEARNELMVEAKRPLKMQMQAELAGANGNEKEVLAIKTKFDNKEKTIEHQIDFTPLRMDMQLEVEYNFLGNGHDDGA